MKAVDALFLLLFESLPFLLRALESLMKFFLELGRAFLGQNARVDQFFFVKLSDRRAPGDSGVKVGLSEERFIPFVVAVTSIAIHVDDRIASKFLAKIERRFSHKTNGNWIVAVHMKDRNFDHLRDIGCIHG